MSRITGKIQGVAFDAFGTMASAPPVGTVLPWHNVLTGAERREVRSKWMRGEIDFEDLFKIGDVDRAPPAEIVKFQAYQAASTISLLPKAAHLHDRTEPARRLPNGVRVKPNGADWASA